MDEDLKRLQRLADDRSKRLFADCVDQLPADLDKEDLQAVVEVLRDVAKTEFDREMNLNTRAAAVAAVAGLIATAAGAVGKSIFAASEVRPATVWLFLIGLVAAVAAMLMAVVGVLRPGQAPTRRMFFTDTLVGIWRERGRSTLSARRNDMNVLLGDRLLRTIALWSVRNRAKARWLRRAWLFLAVGVLLVGLAGLFVVSATLKDYSDVEIFAIAGVGLLIVLGVLCGEAVLTDRGPDQQAEDDEEWKEIANWLLGDDPTGT